MDKNKLYDTVAKVLAKGYDVEIRKKPDGTWVIKKVKRDIVT